MSFIITTTQVQQKIGKISESIEKQSYIVTNRGEGRIVMLPYYDGCDEKISEYMEDYEMAKNQKKLQERYRKSSRSGKSSLKV
jgi:PHD/YefM family antitoxin component YafN of YafNO toxin-antitoxin module